MDAWVTEHLGAPEAIWQAFRDFPETEAEPAEQSEEDAEAEEEELAALLGYAEQMRAQSFFSDPGAEPPPPMDFDLELDIDEE